MPFRKKYEEENMPRNKVAQLPFDKRMIVCRELINGAGPAVVRRALAAAGVEKKDIPRNSSAYRAYKRYGEFRRYRLFREAMVVAEEYPTASVNVRGDHMFVTDANGRVVVTVDGN